MTTKKNRNTYTAEFKAEALKLAERVGVAEAATCVMHQRKNLRPASKTLN